MPGQPCPRAQYGQRKLDTSGDGWDIEGSQWRRLHERRAWGVPMTPDDSRAGSLDGLRVMVIDDSKTIRRTAETLPKREGADVDTATGGVGPLANNGDHPPP